MSAPTNRPDDGDQLHTMLPLVRRMHRDGHDVDTIAEELDMDPTTAASLWAACERDCSDDDDPEVIGYAEPEPDPEPEQVDDPRGRDYGWPDDWAFRVNPRETF